MKSISYIIILVIAGCLGLPAGQAQSGAESLTPERRKEMANKANELSVEGMQQYHRRNFVKAADALRRALDINRAIYPKKDFPNGHGDLALSINILGTLYEAMGESTKAEPLHREALELYRSLYPKKDFPNGHADLAESINILASFYRAIRENPKAEALYCEALEMYRTLYPRKDFPYGHTDLAGSINNLAALYRATGESSKAAPLFREALDMVRTLYPKKDFPNGHADLARSINNLAVIYVSIGEPTKAEPLYREALDMYRSLYPKKDFSNGHADLASSLNNLAALYKSIGGYSKAEPLYREALDMYRTLYPRKDFPNGHAKLARSIHHLGNLYSSIGEYSKAEPLYREALDMDGALYPKKDFPNGHADLASSINSLGLLYQAIGEHTKAEPLYREALDINRTLYPRKDFPNGHPYLAASMNNLGFLYLAIGEYSKAEPLYRQALAMLRTLYPRKNFPDGHTELATSLNNLGTLYETIGEYSKAEPLWREALAMRRTLYPKKDFPNGHADLASSIGNLGLLYRAIGETTKAEPLYREVLDMVRALYPKKAFPNGHADLANRILNLGSLYKDMGQSTKAEPLCREAVAMQHQLLRQFASLAAEAESRNFASTQPLAHDVLLSVSRTSQQPAQAYDTLWDGRALLTRLEERRHRDVLASANPDTTQLAAQLRQTRESLARLLLNPTRAPERRLLQVQKLTDDKEDLEKRIAARLHLPVGASASATTTPQQLSQALSSNTVFVNLIRYYLIEQDPKIPGRKGQKAIESYVAFVVCKDKVDRIELQTAEAIDEAWAAWHDSIVDRKANERAAAAWFASLVWQPIRQALPADVQTVYLTADGKLAQVPWAALPGQKSDSVLLEDYAICLVPHGPWLLERLQNKAPPAFAHDRLLVYGGVAFDEEPASVLQGDGVRAPLFGEKSVRWPDLAGTAREQQHIATMASKALKSAPIVRSGKSASTAQVLQDLPKARYAHVATHGFFADPQYRSYVQADPKLFEMRAFGERRSAAARSPLVLSALVLAGANRRGPDAAADLGILTAESLIGLPLEGLELAVLSACDTGLGEAGGGEGVYGLQRAFHIAGCHNVIASLWKVDDDATQALMTLFYRNLWDKKLDAAEALRQAQLTLYRNPGAVAVAKRRGLDFSESDLPKEAPNAPQKAGRASVAQWAAFTYSGVRPAR
jgi:CHAT domain-containing protein